MAGRAMVVQRARVKKGMRRALLSLFLILPKDVEATHRPRARAPMEASPAPDPGPAPTGPGAGPLSSFTYIDTANLPDSQIATG